MKKEQKTIIEVIPQLSSGGAERFIIDLCNELAIKNTVILIVFFPIQSTWFYLQDLSPKIKLISLNKKKGFDISLIWKIINLISKLKPDVVHAHLRAFNYVFLTKLIYWNIPFFYTVHNDAKVDSGGNLNVIVRKFIFRLKLLHAITISGESQRSFYSLFKVPSFLIYNGRSRPGLSFSDAILKEINSYKSTPNTKILVNIASIQSSKNQIMLARCFKKLVDKYDIVLLIIGRKTDYRIEEQIRNLDCDRIYLLGEREHPVTYMSIADAFCLSSSYEGMPITLIECFSVGCVPICTPVGGIKDVVKDGENGILATTVKEKDYYIALKRFLDMHPNQIQQIKSNSYATYQNFSIEECAKQYLNIFNLVNNG